MAKEDELECQTDLECLTTMLEQTRQQIFGKWLDGELCGRMEAEDLGFTERMKSHKANLEAAELELKHIRERMNLCEKVAEDKGKEIKNLKRKVEEVQAETDKILLERERLAKVLKESEQNNKRTKESIESQSKATEEVTKELEKAAGYFSERMGMKINKVSGERVQIIFTSIDDKDPQQPFCFCVKITKERSYTVTDCEPLVKDLDELSQKLNKTNDFRSFVITMTKAHMFMGNLPQLKPAQNRFHRVVTAWSKEHGPVFRLKVPHSNMCIVSSYEGIHEMLLAKGKEVSGRPLTPWRLLYTLKGTGVLFSAEANQTWKMLRKVSHRHLKQFGDGMSRLESVITEVAEDMFGVFRQHAGKPLNPKATVFETALKSISFLITGDRPEAGDPLLDHMREYEPLFMQYAVSASNRILTLIDIFPILRFVCRENWKKVRRVVEVEHAIWEGVQRRLRDHPEQESLARLLMAHAGGGLIDGVDNNKLGGSMASGESRGKNFTEEDARRTCVSLLLAGITTTSSSFTALINILAHRPQVQDNILEDIRSVAPDGRPVTLIERPEMPYTRAVIYELLRYFTVVAVGVIHRTMTDVTIQGRFIPNNTRVLTNLWAMHHDEKFWGDPDVFRPERFLDDGGQLLPADHPNRKHLMPFGAGLRVCVGESLALARLFLWTVTMIQRFRIQPAPGNSKSLTDADNFDFRAVLYSKPYEVIFTERQTKESS